MARGTRIANKTQWALLDVVSACGRGKRALAALRARNEQLMDPLFAIQLSRLSDALAMIEVVAVRAQHGEYVQEIGDGTSHGN